MPSYTIANAQVNEMELRRVYHQVKQNYPRFDYTDLDMIFAVALLCRDRFPFMNLAGVNTVQAYLARWVGDYYSAYTNPPSARRAHPKSACSDPAIRRIVRMTQGITEAQSAQLERYHNLFMSAENIQGNLLEEYIATSARPYGWIWCAGNTLRAIDFCSSDGQVLLQVKNKSNTENSSSSNIRQGTPIQKWYRLATRSSNGEKFPSYKWDSLNQIINGHRTAGLDLPPCEMTEERYIQFLTNIAAINPDIITAE